ncbi:pilus assembly protein [Duganella sp. sic0402]|uniref:TadE/TadG family type IV pilus assembly protein n=1 Tax=Duganella sp. sic0402 TaxID=2854786 RepID=UPI001C43CCDE|nr:TadE family protein [Duganella sp. sic0402]MBV7535631.1 pilus assembly protein [Duganella sp. sic0402]
MNHARSRQRGAVALELALCLPVLLTVLASLLFYGRVLYSYEVVQKSAWAGARYLSSVPAMNIKNPLLSTQEINLATAMIRQELGTVAPDPGALIVFISCDGGPCNGLPNYLPASVTVTVMFDLQSTLHGYADSLPSLRMRASHTMRYVGN